MTLRAPDGQQPRIPPEAEVLSWFDTLSDWGRWGTDDVLGTLNLMTPAKRVEAARLVKDGTTVSCAWDIEPATRPGFVGHPLQRHMLYTAADPVDVRTPGQDQPSRAGSAAEYLGLVFHGPVVTHIDALSHMFWDDRMYGGRAADLVTTAHGATALGIETAAHGVATRGVLLDATALAGRDWLEPGEAVYPEHLVEMEAAQGVRVSEGDAVLLYTGDGLRRPERGDEVPLEVGRGGMRRACPGWPSVAWRWWAATAGKGCCRHRGDGAVATGLLTSSTAAFSGLSGVNRPGFTPLSPLNAVATRWVRGFRGGGHPRRR